MAGSVHSAGPEPRRAAPGELARLLEIEQQAGQRLHGHPAAAVFAGHGLSLAELQQGMQRGQLWVIDGADGTLAGYLLGAALDGHFHLLQMDVDPRHGRQGLGRRLLRHALARAAAAGYPGALLSTLCDVPWNAPFYASEGFRPLPAGRWQAGLRAVMAQEAALGFPMQLRLAMRRSLP